MVIRPLHFAPKSQDSTAPAWPAVEARQKQQATSYLVVSQPEHARLSGELAAHFVSPLFPALNDDAVRAITAHDSGWASFKGESADLDDLPMLTESGKPRSFIEFPPRQFVEAWTASIENSANASSLGGIMVSRHFTALAQHALSAQQHRADDAEVLTAFVEREQQRQHRLLDRCSCSPSLLDGYVKALQFCDLLSLALCSDVREPVTFPQDFSGTRVRMTCDGSAFTLAPSPFARDSQSVTIELTAKARLYSPPGETRREVLTFHVR